jgi:hypothetical protein
VPFVRRVLRLRRNVPPQNDKEKKLAGQGKTSPTPLKSAPVMPFPDLGRMLAEREGLIRPPRPPLPSLPARPDPEKLPREVLDLVLGRMANLANWREVAYRASNHRTVADGVQAEWKKQDAQADVNETFELLTPTQAKIARAAFAGGMDETARPDLPGTVTLEWVQRNYPPRDDSRPSRRF